MHTTSKLLASLFMIAFLASCNKKPIAAFSPSVLTPLIDEEVTFTNSSTNGETYSWDFGDGTSSEAQSPKKAYAIEGTYNVSLTTYLSDGRKWDKVSKDITVIHPAALFTGYMDGIATRLMNAVDGAVYRYGYSGSVSGGTVTRVYEAMVGKYSGPITLEEMKLEIGTITYSDTLTLAETHPIFHAAIRVQDYTYSTGPAAGVRISYVDPSGMIWATDAGTAVQTGSTFIITYTKDMADAGFEAEFMKAHFTCNVYNGLGGVRVITDGTLELIFGNKP